MARLTDFTFSAALCFNSFLAYRIKLLALRRMTEMTINKRFASPPNALVSPFL